MTNNKPNDVCVVSVELLEEIVSNLSFCGARHKLTEILAQPADQQGEPFAWMCFDFEGGHDFTEDAERAERWRKSLGEKYKGCLTPLYRHAQPARAKVALPERKKVDPYCYDQGGNANVQGWNACLDEVTKLNGGQS